MIHPFHPPPQKMTDDFVFCFSPDRARPEKKKKRSSIHHPYEFGMS